MLIESDVSHLTPGSMTRPKVEFQLISFKFRRDGHMLSNTGWANLAGIEYCISYYNYSVEL